MFDPPRGPGGFPGERADRRGDLRPRHVWHSGGQPGGDYQGRRPAAGAGQLRPRIPGHYVLCGSGFSGVIGLTEGTLGQITSGTLTVTTSTASAFEGTTRFAAVVLSPAGAELNVAIDITFNATCSTICN